MASQRGGLRISFRSQAGYSFHALDGDSGKDAGEGSAQLRFSPPELQQQLPTGFVHRPESHTLSLHESPTATNTPAAQPATRPLQMHRSKVSDYSLAAGGALRADKFELSEEDKLQRQSTTVAMVLNRLIGSRRKVYGKLMRDAEQVFRTLDKDGSGALDYAEFAVALKRMGLGLSPTQVRQLIDVMDENHDGLIDCGEFVSNLELARQNHRAIGKESLSKAQLHLKQNFRRSNTGTELGRQQQIRRALCSHSVAGFIGPAVQDDVPPATDWDWVAERREQEIKRIAKERGLTERYIRDQYMRHVALTLSGVAPSFRWQQQNDGNNDDDADDDTDGMHSPLGKATGESPGSPTGKGRLKQAATRIMNLNRAGLLTESVDAKMLRRKLEEESHIASMHKKVHIFDQFSVPRSTVWVGGLPEEFCEEKKLRDVFEQCGVVRQITVRWRSHHAPGATRSWCMVTFETDKEARCCERSGFKDVFPVPPAWISATRSSRAAADSSVALQAMGCPPLREARGVISRRTRGGTGVEYLVHWWPEQAEDEGEENAGGASGGPSASKEVAQQRQAKLSKAAQQQLETLKALGMGHQCWIAREILSSSRLCAGYMMEYEYEGNVDAGAGVAEMTSAMVAERFAAANKIQAQVRGRQSRCRLKAQQ